ncbi:hypothetical protein A2U01_0012762, partial [Trifolium medium]|nr:hypothetical protein [Trifolium medium]
QQTATTSKTRSTRSKAKVGTSAIIADVVPISTVHASESRKDSKSKSAVKKEKSTKVSELSPSMSIKSSKKSSKKKSESTVRKPLSMIDLYLSKNPFQTSGVESNVDTSVKDSKTTDVEASEKVVIDTKISESEKSNPAVTLIPENPKSDEKLGQSVLNVADATTETAYKDDVASSAADMSRTNDIVGFVLNSLKETVPKTNVEPDVGTSLAPPGSSDEESGYESAVEKDKSEEKTATKEGELSGNAMNSQESEKTVSGDDVENPQSVESDKTVPLDEEVNVSEKTVDYNREVVNVDDLDSTEQPLSKTIGGSIAKR